MLEGRLFGIPLNSCQPAIHSWPGNTQLPDLYPRRSTPSVTFSEHGRLAIYHSVDESGRTVQDSFLEDVTAAPLLALSYEPSEIQP